MHSRFTPPPLKYLWNGSSYSRQILCACSCRLCQINQSISMNLLWRPTSKALGRQKYNENTTASQCHNNDSAKRWVLSLVKKSVYVDEVRMCEGRRFQADGAATEKKNCLKVGRLAIGLLTISERGVAQVTWSILEFYTPLNFSGMAEDRIVKFCARVSPRSISLVMTNCPPSGRGQGHVTS